MAYNSGDNSLSDISQSQPISELPAELSPFLGGILNEFAKLKSQVSQLKEENKRLSDALAQAGINVEGRAVNGGSRSSGGLISGDCSVPANPSEQPQRGGASQPAAPHGSGIYYRQEAAHNMGDAAQPLAGPPQPKIDLATNEMLQYVADELDVSSWQPFMRTLGMPDNQLEVIRHDFIGVEEQKYQALLLWKKSFGVRAVTERLVKTLLARRHRYLAERFCKKFPGYDHLLKTKY